MINPPTSPATQVHIGPNHCIIDDHDLSHLVTAVDVEARPGQPTIMTLHLAVKQVIVEGDIVHKLPDVTIHALRTLGWTPPA